MFTSLFALGLTLAHIGAAPKEMPLTAIPWKQVQLRGGFWGERQHINSSVTISHCLDMLDRVGTTHNFELAAKHQKKDRKGYVFVDSDLYKTIEAAAYSLQTNPDPGLEERVDKVIDSIAAAQMPDGYLNTFYQVQDDPGKRFTNLAWNHELYCAGHLFEAAVAYHEATGKRKLLEVAAKYADLLDSTFGDEPGKRPGYPGHPEIELALVKLAHETGQDRYFKLAQFFLDHRGTHEFAKEQNTPEDKYDGGYWFDDVPLRQHTKIVGHAVRAVYLMCGATDVGYLTGDKPMLDIVDRVWSNVTEKNMYVTGGIGASASNEGFTHDYDLPNLDAYQETCASVAMAIWAERMCLTHKDAKYADVMERAMYNGVLAGVSLDGKKFFYVNPLESHGDKHRQEWFDCACCPPNAARLIASIGGYAYAGAMKDLWVNLFVAGEMKAGMWHMTCETDYPWDGHVRYTVLSANNGHSSFHLRIPGWSSGVTIAVNGQPAAFTAENGYAVIKREWKKGDVVDYNIPMPVRQIASDPHVVANQGKLALARGPLIYCLEGLDQPADLSKVTIPSGARFEIAESKDWKHIRVIDVKGSTPVRAIPYFTWDNRTPTAMKLWIPTL